MIILVCILLIILSSFFSSYETAFYSLEKGHHGKNQKILFMLNVILMGNATVRVLFSEISGHNLDDFFGQWGLSAALTSIIVIAVTSLVLIIFGESIPLNFGMAYPQFVYKRLSWFIKGAMVIFWPIVKPLTWGVGKMIQALESRYHKQSNLTEDEVRSIIQLSYERDIVNPHEKQLTDAVINLYSQPVSFYMIPRRDIPVVDLEDTIGLAWQKMKDFSLTKLVVQQGSIDNIVGYLALEDIALIEGVSVSVESISTLGNKIRQHVIIPESKKLIDAIELLRQQRRSLGVVIDEYGGLDGIVTMNRLLGSLLVFDRETSFEVGETKDDIGWIEQTEDGILVNALRTTLRMVLEYFNQEVEWVQEEEWSISRLILKKLDRFPKEGEELQIQHLYFRVISMQNRAISKVFIRLIDEEKQESEIIYGA